MIVERVLLCDVLCNGSFWMYANSKRVKIIEGFEVGPSPQSAGKLERMLAATVKTLSGRGQREQGRVSQDFVALDAVRSERRLGATASPHLGRDVDHWTPGSRPGPM